MEQICKELLTNGPLRSLALKLAGDLHEDLIQEVALAMLENDKDISEYWQFWCVRTMMNMTTSTGTFWRKYSQRYIDFNELAFQRENDYDPTADEYWDGLDEIFDKEEWYKKEMLRTYFELGTYRAIEDTTGIDHVSCYKTVKQALKILNERTNNSD